MHWRMLFLQTTRWAFSFAPASAGNSIAARMAMMAITTSSSIKVNASVPKRMRVEDEKPLSDTQSISIGAYREATKNQLPVNVRADLSVKPLIRLVERGDWDVDDLQFADSAVAATGFEDHGPRGCA